MPQVCDPSSGEDGRSWKGVPGLIDAVYIGLLVLLMQIEERSLWNGLCHKTAGLGPGEPRQLGLSQWCVLLPDKVVVAGRERHDHNSNHNLDTGCFPRCEGRNQPMYLSRKELAVRVSESEGSRPPSRYFARAVSACPSASYP
jgi:hypothetical protein